VFVSFRIYKNLNWRTWEIFEEVPKTSLGETAYCGKTVWDENNIYLCIVMRDLEP
jgi:hypothetical protein